MPSIEELKKMRDQVHKEQAKAAGHDAKAVEKVMEAKRQAEYDELSAELSHLKEATAARGQTESAATSNESREDEAKRLLKASQKVMSGTPIAEVRAGKSSTSTRSSASAQSSTPTNGEQ